jgi:D-beta-D-heptose 7-phosphate kinase/D-beta-D-heptose 1-phosphate adenosyltransferase
VANLVATLGGQVTLWGLVGDDDAADRLLSRCRRAGIDATHVRRERDRSTTRKVRVLAQNRQVLRLDWDETRPAGGDVGARAVAELRAAGPFDAVILSDYAKGFLTPEVIRGAIDAARSWSAPVLVDPKSPDFTRYRGATVITPNQKEFEDAGPRKLGEDVEREVAQAGAELLETAGAEHLVVTLGERGLAIVSRDAEPAFYGTTAREVYDVTGAGDTVVAVLGLALASGTTLRDAACLANRAAGFAVGRSGVAVVSPADLLSEFAPRLQGKVFSREELLERIDWWRMQNRRIVFTNGCFDLLHVGHVSLLRETAKHGDVLIVAINSDASVRRLKGEGRPLITASERAAVLAALQSVDAVVEFDEDTPLELLKQIQPDVLAKGADYSPDQVVGRELVERLGGRVVTIPLVSSRSTSLLVERIQALRAPADSSRPADHRPRWMTSAVTRREDLSSPPRLWGWQTWASMAVALGVLGFLATRVDFEAVWRELVATDKRLVLLGLLAHYATYYFRGARWKLVLGHTPRRVSRFKYGLVVFFYNFVDNLVPAKLGDLYAAHMARINFGVRRSEALGSIVFLRMVDAWIVLALAATSSWLLFSARLPALVFWALVAGVLFALGSSAVMLALLFLHRKTPPWIPDGVRRMVRDFRERMVPNRRNVSGIVVLTATIWLLEALWIYWLTRAFGLELSPVTVVFLTMIPLLASALPFTPSGAGAVELVLYSCSIVVGVPAAVAASLTFLNRVIDYWLHIALGVVFWAIRHRVGMRAWSEEQTTTASPASSTPVPGGAG